MISDFSSADFWGEILNRDNSFIGVSQNHEALTSVRKVSQSSGREETGICPKQGHPTKTKMAINKSWTRSGRVSALAGIEKQRTTDKGKNPV